MNHQIEREYLAFVNSIFKRIAKKPILDGVDGALDDEEEAVVTVVPLDVSLVVVVTKEADVDVVVVPL